MGQIIVNYEGYTVTESNFDIAVSFFEEVFGYEGEAWDVVIASNDLYALCEFLQDDGVDAKIKDN